MPTTTKNPPRKSAGLKSVTVMADSVAYGDEMAKQLRVWDELVRDVRANAYELPPSRLSDIDNDRLLVGVTDFSDTPLYEQVLRETESAAAS